MVRLASGDVGNDAFKGFLGDLNNKLYIPNVIVSLNSEERDVIELEKDPLSALHVQILSGALKRGKGNYLVGKLASTYPNNDELTPDSEKSENDQTIVVLLTALAYDAAMNLKAKDGVIDAKYFLSTGLPLNEVKKKKKKEFREKLKNNQHEVTFLQTPKFQGLKVRISFEQVLVNTEGYAALVDMTTNDDGSSRNEELTKMNVLIQDIGGLSTDVAIIMKDGSIDNRNSLGIRDGVSSALDEISQNVVSKTNIEYFKSRMDVVHCLTNGDPSERGHIKIKGNRKVSIKEIYDPILMRLAREEYKHTQSLWDKVPTLDRAYYIGGGSSLLKPYIEKVNEEQDQLPIYFVDVEESIWMISRAYFKLLQIYLAQKETISMK